ncbi:MAG: hypothetical protein SOZ59_10615 [Candidatus Limivivens sp.]|nr:hypothetical protein [Candidatus Limivivens sp.]
MKDKIMRECRIQLPDLLAELLFPAGAAVLGIGFLAFISWRHPEESYVAIGSIMAVMMVVVLSLFAGTKKLINEFNRAVAFGQTRRDFLVFHSLIIYVFLLLELFLIRGWAEIENRIGAAWFSGKMDLDICSWLRPELLPVYALVLLGIRLFFMALLIRYMKMATVAILALWMLFVLGFPNMMDAVSEAPDSLLGVMGRGLLDILGGIPEKTGIVMLNTVGVLMVGGAVLLLRKQRVTA